MKILKNILVVIISVLFISYPAFAETKAKAPFNYDLEKDITRNSRSEKPKDLPVHPEEDSNKEDSGEDTQEKDVNRSYATQNRAWESQYSVYPNATLNSAVSKYKNGNYSGSLQELISLTKIDPANPLVYYYLGMAYTQVGDKEQAINAYENVLKLNSNYTLTMYATKGRDCLVGGPACMDEEQVVKQEPQDELDKFVNSPYGNGFSQELEQQQKDLQLRNFKKQINSKQELNDSDIQNIQEFDKSSNADTTNKTAKISNEDVLAAIETLKKAGVTVTVNPYPTPYPMNDEYAQLSMMLGSNNNNNNNMMNMLPMLMAQQGNGKNLDPQIFQSMMMSSMLPDFTFNDKKDY